MNREAQFQRLDSRMHDMARHISESTCTVFPPSAPIPRMIDVVERSEFTRSCKQIPIQRRRYFIDFRRGIQTLRPNRTVGSAIHAFHLTDLAVPDPFADLIDTFARCPLITHLARDLIFLSQLRKQTRFVNRVSQRFLYVNVFAQRNGIGRNNRVRVVGRSHDHSVDRFAHFVVHLPIVPILLGFGMRIEYFFGILPVHIAKSDDVFSRRHLLDVGISHSADTHGGNIQLIRRGGIAMTFT